MICKNDFCRYFQGCKIRNQIFFEKSGICSYCDCDPEHVPCVARKYTAFLSDFEADVYLWKTFEGT